MHFESKLLMLFISAVLFGSSSALARDISKEQLNASKAREHYLQTKANDEQLTLEIQRQEKRLLDEQAKLKALQDKQVNAKTQLESAKVDLDAKVKILMEVWEQRDK